MDARESFDEREHEWRARLQGRSLVMEADIDAREAISALDVLARNMPRMPSPSARHRLALQYRAVLVSGMCAIGSTQYEAGSYWPSLPSGFEAAGDPGRQKEVAKAFRDALSALALARFTTPLRNVGEILMHAGVPTRSIPKFVETLVKWDSRHVSGDGAGFVAWARAVPNGRVSQGGLDMPTWRFLSEGGEIAEDFVDRCLVAIDADGTDPGLPIRVLGAIQAAIANKRLRSRATGGRKGAALVPAIVYEPHVGVQVRLPPLEHELRAAVSWKVTAGGFQQRRDVPAPWPGDPVIPTRVSVASPQKQIAITFQPGGQEWSLGLVDNEEPLLVFEALSGAMIPSRNSMPKGRVRVALPNLDGVAVTELLEVNGSFHVIEQFDTPHGWGGWTFAEIDTSALQKIRVKGFGDRWRYVSIVDRPQFRLATRLEYATTPAGHPVMAQRPRLALPGSATDNGSIAWTVAVTDAGGTVVADSTFMVSGGALEVDPWEPIKVPVLGEYTVTVRGPLGRGATLQIAVAEDTILTPSTAFRWMSDLGTGLESAVATITAPGAAIELGAGDVSYLVTLARTGQSLDIVVTIPYLSTSASGSIDRRESIVPIPLDIEGLDGTTLRAHVPTTARRVTLAALVDGEILQTVESQGAAGSTTRSFNLSQLADTLTRHGSAVLRLVVDDRSVPVAQVRPRRLAQSLAVDADGQLELVGGQPVEGLVAFAYPKYAPWRSPTRLVFAPGETRVVLPDKLRREGRAKIVLAVDNPWTPIIPPPTPDYSSGNDFSVEVGNLVEVDDLTERGFRSWLAGLGTCPSFVEGLPVALTTYTRLPATYKREQVDVLRSELAAAVRVNRERLMEAVLETDADVNDLFRLFVESDVVTVPREAWVSSTALWDLAPSLGVIADSDELGGPNEDEFVANVEYAVGAAGTRIIHDGNDPYATVGRFDTTAAIMAKWPPDRVDDVWKAATVLRKGLLDKDSRADASKALFDVRSSRALRYVASAGNNSIVLAEQALTQDFGLRALVPITARRFQDGWANLPAVSIALALVARGFARGGDACGLVYERVRGEFAQLAAEAPRIVQQDLGLAELWITRWEDVE